MVKYSLLEDKDKVFASKYQLYLPTVEELQENLLTGKEMYEKVQEHPEII